MVDLFLFAFFSGGDGGDNSDDDIVDVDGGGDDAAGTNDDGDDDESANELPSMLAFQEAKGLVEKIRAKSETCSSIITADRGSTCTRVYIVMWYIIMCYILSWGIYYHEVYIIIPDSRGVTYLDVLSMGLSWCNSSSCSCSCSKPLLLWSI